MFIELLSDIILSIREQKLRTLLTGFGVAWGIFILILLLGASGGLEKGVLQIFSGFAQNSIWFYGGNVTAEIGKNSYSRPVVFDEDILYNLKRNYSDKIESISPEIQKHTEVGHKEKKIHTTTKGVLPDYFKIKILQAAHGRLINEQDDKNQRNMAVIGERIKDQLFGKQNALGADIVIDNHVFTIIGVLKSGTIFDQAEQNSIFIPLSAGIKLLQLNPNFNVIGLTLKSGINTKTAESHISNYLAHQLLFDPSDSNALYVVNYDQQVKSFQKLFSGLNIFFWFIGICLLLSGMVGVTNIMFVIVNERTSEIGIRKAIGATNKNILNMILTESAIITLLAGIIGIIIGAIIISMGSYLLDKIVDKDFIIKDISINWITVVGALVILVLSGLAAGLIPAKRATEIEPIDAIRNQ